MADDARSGLNLVGTTVANIKNDLLGLASVIENQVTPKVRNLVSELEKGANLYGSLGGTTGGKAGGKNKVADNGAPAAAGGEGGGGGAKIAQSGAEGSGGFGKALAAFGGGIGVANLIAQAMPSANTAVQQNLLTAQSAFYGQGGYGGGLGAQMGRVNALQNQLARMGIATTSMDTTQALATAQNLGLSGAQNFNSVMQGAGITSTFAPGIGVTGAVNVQGTLNAPNTVNMLKTVGINVRDMNGNVKPIPQVVDQLWNFITNNNTISLSENDIQISLMPGNGLYGMLTSLLGNDPTSFTVISNMLIAKAKTGGKQSLASMSKKQLQSMGLSTTAVGQIAGQTAAKTELLTKAAGAEAGAYGISADLGAAMNRFVDVVPGLTQALGAFTGGYTGVMGLGNGTMGTVAKTGMGFAAGQGIMAAGKALLPRLLMMLPFLADGGPADSNKPYIVGERGPELFVPKNDGVVVPNHLIGKPNRAGGGPVKGGGMTTGEDLTNFLVKQGFSQAGAEGVVGNLAWESNLNTNALGDNKTSYGLAQWHGGRWTNLNKFAASQGLDPSTADAQMQFLMKELGQKQYKGLLETLKNPDVTKADAAAAFMRQFERPANQSNSMAIKRANAYKGTLGVTSVGALTDSTAGAAAVNSSLSTASSGADYSSQIQGLISSAAGAIGLTPGGVSNTYNNGPLTINITGASDPKKVAAEVQKVLAANNVIAKVGGH